MPLSEPFPACYTDYPRRNPLFYKNPIGGRDILVNKNQIWNSPKRKIFDADDDLFLFDEAIDN